MNWVFLALLAVMFPVFVSYAKGGTRQRDHLLIGLGALLFATGTLSLDASVIGWPTWPGTARGIIFSFVDCIAIALIASRRGPMKVPPFLGLFALFLVPMIVATLIANTKLASVFSLFQFFQLIVLYWALAPELERESAVRSLFQGIAIGLLVQAGFVAQQKLTGMVQAYGTTPHQNILGLMVQLTVLPLIAAILEGMRSKIVYMGTFAGLFCLAVGGSRASLAFFSIGLAILLLLSLMRRNSARKWTIVASGMVVAGLFVPLAIGTLRDRFGDAEIGTTDESRIAFERSARAMSADHPFGVGPNNFVPINNTGGYAVEAGIEWGGGLLDKPVHNAYLLARSETGWAGQITLVMLLGGVATAGLFAAFRQRRIPAVGIALGSAAGITTMALHSNYEFAWYTIEIQRLFFVNAALIAGCMAVAAQAKRRPRVARATATETQPRSPVTVRTSAVQGASRGN